MSRLAIVHRPCDCIGAVTWWSSIAAVYLYEANSDPGAEAFREALPTMTCYKRPYEPFRRAALHDAPKLLARQWSSASLPNVLGSIDTRGAQ